MWNFEVFFVDVFVVKFGKVWFILDFFFYCDSKLYMFNELVKIELDIMMLFKIYKLYYNNVLWVIDEFKILIVL